jgi:YspA, cpYpsA-related SLOG family
MKVLVCGDRDWADGAAIRRELERLPPGSTVVHGACRGADIIAGQIAFELGFTIDPNPANWTRDGLRAGPIRNQAMLNKHPDIERVLAFHENIARSTGTKDMVGRARLAGIPVKVFTQ